MIDGKYIKTDLPEYNWVWSPQGLIHAYSRDLGIGQFTNEVSTNKSVSFNRDNFDMSKWALRNLWYRQSNYF